MATQYGSSSLSMDSILANLEASQQKANEANQKRIDQAMGLYDQIISQFSSSGAFGAGVDAMLGRAGERSVAKGTQALVSSGLYNTEARAGLASEFEENVGVPTRLKAEDLRMEKLAGALAGKAGAYERIEDTGPDMNTIASLMKSVGTGGSGGTTYAKSNLPSIFDEFNKPKTPTAPKPTFSRVIDTPGRYSTGTGADSAYSKGTRIRPTYKKVYS